MVDKPQPVQIMQVDLKIIIDKIQLHNISIIRFAPGTETNCNEKAFEAFIYPLLLLVLTFYHQHV